MTEADQKLIFDYVDEKNKGTVPVKDFLKKVEEREFHDQEYNKDALKIRDFIAFHIAQKRSDSPEVLTPELEAIKRKKGIENEAERMRKALGINGDVDPQELNEFIEDVNMNHLPKDHVQRRYARFLQHSNIRLKFVPFYDARSTELNRLKERSARIDVQLASAEMKGKFEDLSMTRWQPSQTTHSLTEEDVMQYTMPKQYSLDDIHNNPDNPGTGLNFNLTKSMPNLQAAKIIRPSPLANIEIPTSSQQQQQGNNNNSNDYNNGPSSFSSPILDNDNNNVDRRPVTSSNRVQLEALRRPATAAVPTTPKYRNLTGTNNNNSTNADKPNNKIYTKPKPTFSNANTNNGDDLSSSSSLAGGQSQATSPSNKTRGSKLIDGLLDSSSQEQGGLLHASDFYCHVIDQSQSMGRLKDSSKVMRIEKIDPNVYSTTTGKRMIDQGPTDWTRVGVGRITSQQHEQEEGNNSSHDMGGYGYIQEQNDQFMTTTNHYYPPLLYEPSQPVARHLVSEADLHYQQRAYIRSQRKARTEANLEVTKTRIEYEALQKEIRSLNRQSSRIDNAIRYKTNFLLNDLQHFRIQPLQRMAKRQNIHLSEKIFGGSIEKQTVGIVDDNRDFTTTYATSFLQNLGKEGGTNGFPEHE